MVEQTVRKTVELLRDLNSYPCFHCDREEPRFCIYRAGKCANRQPRYRGVFPDRESAFAAMPPSKPRGFDSDAMVQSFQQHLSTFNQSDYPVLLRLLQVLRPGDIVFDLGGGYGQCYLSYKEHIVFPEDMKWFVCDVESFLLRGRRIAEDHNETALAFTSNWSDANGSAVYLTNGALQYIEPDLSEILCGLSVKPPHVLVNRVPAYDGEPYYTIQYAEGAYNPYKVMNTGSFIARMAAAGYRMADHWLLPRKLRVPLHPSVSVPAYQGFFFMLK